MAELLSEDQATSTVKTLLELRKPEQKRLERIARYVAGKHEKVYAPRGASNEYHWLRSRAIVNMLPLLIDVVAQNLYVDGYRPAKTDDNAAAWKIWQANRMDGRQHGIHRAALKYGISYALVLPGRFPGAVADGPEPPKTAVITPMSPRRLTAFYADPANDEWPLFAVECTTQRVNLGGKLVSQELVRLVDDMSVNSFVASDNSVTWQKVEHHEMGVCPVVRYLNQVDLDEDEAVAGEVEPLIHIQDQINSTTFGLLMAQQYAAFRQRWIAGMVPEDESGRPRAPFNVGVDRLLVAEDQGTKFGEFEATDLTGYLKSREESIRTMATISQTPPYYLLGQMANLSADALAAARDGLDRKSDERKSTFGESHEQTLRLASLAAGDQDGWADISSQVVWRDTSARALASTVDALGKLSQMLGVPAQELWEKIPGVSQQDITRWKAAVQAATDPFGLLNQQLEKLSDQIVVEGGTPQEASTLIGTGSGGSPR